MNRKNLRDRMNKADNRNLTSSRIIYPS